MATSSSSQTTKPIAADEKAVSNIPSADALAVFQPHWTAVDQYYDGLFVRQDDALAHAVQAQDIAGMPPHNVAPNQGKLLYLLALMNGAKRILEIGTLGGYSTIWLARAVQEVDRKGTVVTLEFNLAHAAVAARTLREPI